MLGYDLLDGVYKRLSWISAAVVVNLAKQRVGIQFQYGLRASISAVRDAA